MSRHYEMDLCVRRAKPDRVDAIKEAAAEQWSFEDWHAVDDPDNPSSFGSTGRDNLCGGEGEEEFAERLVRAIWKANGGYCEVEVKATYLEALPYEVYSFDEEAFAALTGHQNDATNKARA